VARKGKRGSAYRVVVGKPEGRNRLENLGVDGNVVLLKWILKKGVGWGDGLDWRGLG
jgi:hypothetical protein